MSPHLHKNWLCERLFYFNYDTGRCLVTVPFPESALIVLFVIKGGIQSVLFYHSPSWSGERKRRLWRTAGRFLTLCNRTRSWASLHVDLSHLHVTVNRKKKELVFVLFRVYFGSLPLLSYWIRVQNLLQCTISPRDFLKRFSFCFLSVGGFGRYKLGKAVRGGDWGFQTDRDKADLQYSALRLPRLLQPPPEAGAPFRPSPAARAPWPWHSEPWRAPGPAGCGVSTADSARSRLSSLPYGVPPAPLAVCSRGASRALETPSQTPCPEPVSISGQCCTDHNRNPLWTWSFVACITFPKGRSGWVDKKVNVFPVAMDWLSFNRETAS